MKTTPLLIVSLLLACLAATAADNGTSQIWGKVIDKQTQKPIYGVNISLQNNPKGLGTITNSKGEFRLWNIPGDTAKILISSDGYQTLVWDIQSLQDFSYQKNNMATIYLNEKSAVEKHSNKKQLVVNSGPNIQIATAP